MFTESKEFQKQIGSVITEQELLLKKSKMVKFGSVSLLCVLVTKWLAHADEHIQVHI